MEKQNIGLVLGVTFVWSIWIIVTVVYAEVILSRHFFDLGQCLFFIPFYTNPLPIIRYLILPLLPLSRSLTLSH